MFGAFLARAGHEVCLLDRHRRRADELARNGILVERGDRTERVAVHATVDPSACGRVDLVCVCVKAYDTQAAVRGACGLWANDTVVVSLQNGLGNAEIIEQAADPAQVVCGVTSQGATRLGPGHIRHAGAGPTRVASFRAQAREAAEWLVSVLDQAGLNAQLSDDAPGMLWSKLVVNAAVNPLTAIQGVPNGSLVDDPQLHRVMSDAAREAAAVARARRIRLEYPDAVAEAERICRITHDNRSSMLQDVRQGKRTEIDSITGALLEEGRQAGVDTPVNAELYARVREIEKRNRLA